MRRAFAGLMTAAVMAAAAMAATPAAALPATTLSSPDGRITIRIDSDADGVLRYAVTRDGDAILSPSRLRLVPESGSLAGEASAGARRSVDRVQTGVTWKAAAARERFNELSVDVALKPGVAGLRWIFRAYDDGVAFRFVLLPGSGMPALRLRAEDSEFAFAGDPACHGFNAGRYEGPHEGEFDPVPGSRIRSHHLYDAPLVCRTATGRSAFAIAEADLRDYGGMYLAGRDDGLPGVRTRVSPRFGEPGLIAVAPVTAAGAASPWRVVMLADTPGRLIESQLVALLNPPRAPRDWSWVRPGKTAWDWWSGPYLPPPAKGGMDMATLTRFIDFASASGLDYMMIDEGWCLNSGISGSAPDDADVTRTKAGIDMPALVAHARAKGVGLWLWVQWHLLDRQMDAALAQYERWGIRGIKVDFMDRNDQQMVDYYHRLMEKAAAHHLMVDLHGAYPPTGLARTWPNYLTQEGVLGAEYNKWSARVTPAHNVTLAYTRMLLGPMDYTPGGFRNAGPRDFRITFAPPQVQTTRGAALAMYVVYESPLQSVADSPDAYAGADGFDTVRDMPASWDETRFVAGEIGRWIVLARRKGARWYVGAMTDGTARTVTVPLAMLGDGRFDATISEDGDTPATLRHRKAPGVGAADTVRLRLAPGGGAVVRLDPAPHGHDSSGSTGR